MDTRAFNLILASIMIAISLLLFYTWAFVNIGTQQAVVTKGDLTHLRVDEILATWANEDPDGILAKSNKVEEEFKKRFLREDYKVEDIDCEDSRCEFELKKTKPPEWMDWAFGGDYVLEYQRDIYFPGKQIRFKGRLIYD